MDLHTGLRRVLYSDLYHGGGGGCTDKETPLEMKHQNGCFLYFLTNNMLQRQAILASPVMETQPKYYYYNNTILPFLLV